MEKVLIIAPYPVFPPNTGGKIRTFELAKGLSENNLEVTVVMPMSPSQFSRLNFSKRLTLEVIPYPFIIPFLFTDKPFPYLNLISFHPGYYFFVKKFFKSFDIIQFEGVSFADLIDWIPPQKSVVYDAHNVEFDYSKSESRWQWVRDMSSQRIHKLEKKLAERADQILTCSTNDSERISELYDIKHNKFSLIPNGIHINKQTSCLNIKSVQKRFPKLFDFPQRAIFSGSDVAHNRAAVHFIIGTLAPQLDQHCAFIIKGQCGNRFQHKENGNIFFESEPDNVGPYADICTVALNPVTQGSGTSLKVLDYLVHDLPVISTEFGMRGFDDLKKYVVLAKLESFCEKLRQEHHLDPKLTLKLEKYSWRSISKTLFESYHT